MTTHFAGMLLAALCLLAAATSASAGKERKIEMQRLGLGADHPAVKSSFSGGLFDGARMWTFYRCLPDTVDPRETKGK